MADNVVRYVHYECQEWHYIGPEGEFSDIDKEDLWSIVKLHSTPECFDEIDEAFKNG